MVRSIASAMRREPRLPLAVLRDAPLALLRMRVFSYLLPPPGPSLALRAFVSQNDSQDRFVRFANRSSPLKRNQRAHGHTKRFEFCAPAKIRKIDHETCGFDMRAESLQKFRRRNCRAARGNQIINQDD